MKPFNRVVVFFLFVFCLSGVSYSGKLKAEYGIEMITKDRVQTNKSFVVLLSDYPQSLFVSEEEWARFMKLLIKRQDVNTSKEYPELCFILGDYYRSQENYQDAYYYLYITLTEEPDIYTSTKNYVADFHEALGHIYYCFHRFDLAEKHLRIALKHPQVSEMNKIKLYNTLSLIYRDKGDNATSEQYLQRAYNQAVKLKDEIWMGILSGNLGYIAFTKNEREKARQLIQFDYDISAKNRQIHSQMNALALLIELDLLEGKEAQKESILRMRAFDSLMLHQKDAGLLAEYYRIKNRYYESIGNDKQALEHYKRYALYRDEFTKKSQYINLLNAEFQINFEKKQVENLLFREKEKRNQLLIIGLIVICLLLGVTSFIIIKQIQRKRKQDKELFVLRAKQAEDELHATERELRALLSTMYTKNKIIVDLQEQVELLEKSSVKQTTAEKDKMLNDLQSFTLLTEGDWIEFKRLFEKLHPGFIEYFKDNFPDVTSAELRLAALIKLNLSNLEMARTLAISPDSVRKTNLRLRKKLNIESTDDLVRFIRAV